jgi:ribose transport system permease protein
MKDTTSSPERGKMEAAVEAGGRPRYTALDILSLLGKYGTVLTLFIMVLSFGLLSDTFRSRTNLTNMLGQIAFLSIISAGLTCCLKVGDFDLSIGAVATFAGNVVARLLASGNNMVLSICLALATGIVIGIGNGILTAYVGFHSLICTLATMAIIMGATEFLTGGISIWSGIPEDFAVLGKGELMGFPVRFLIMVAAVLTVWFIHKQTEVGRKMEAIGGNPVASRLSGIDVNRNRLFAFVLSGFFAAMTGILVTSSLMSSDANIGIGFTFPAIVACFIGAATIRLGHFHVFGTLVGVLLMVVATNGLIILLVPSYLMDIVRGGVLLTAISLASVSRKLLNQ